MQSTNVSANASTGCGSSFMYFIIYFAVAYGLVEVYDMQIWVALIVSAVVSAILTIGLIVLIYLFVFAIAMVIALIVYAIRRWSA